jgi:hypothetical protein
MGRSYDPKVGGEVVVARFDRSKLVRGRSGDILIREEGRLTGGDKPTFPSCIASLLSGLSRMEGEGKLIRCYI